MTLLIHFLFSLIASSARTRRTPPTMIFAYTKRNWWSLLLVCAIIVAGVWLNRYLLVVPASISDHTPFSSTSELLLVGGVFAGFLLVYLLLIKAFPMISEWELRDAAGEEGPAY